MLPQALECGELASELVADDAAHVLWAFATGAQLSGITPEARAGDATRAAAPTSGRGPARSSAEASAARAERTPNRPARSGSHEGGMQGCSLTRRGSSPSQDQCHDQEHQHHGKDREPQSASINILTTSPNTGTQAGSVPT